MIEYENLAELNKPYVEQLEEAFREVLRSGNFILGDNVSAFESAFASYTGSACCVGVGNGTDALTIALRCFGFKQGAEVIVPSNTYLATVLAVIHAGLKPVLVEPDVRTYNLDSEMVEAAITSRCVAIIPVHLYGKCCHMDNLKTLAGRHNLRIIEDCAQAHGARYKGQHAGTFGDFGAFSFYPTKNLGAFGDGGCLITSDEELSARARSLRNYGFVRKDYAEAIGYNSRLDEVQAAFLNRKLGHLDQLNEKRRALALRYDESLSNYLVAPLREEGILDVYYAYCVRHPKRDLLKARLLEAGIETRIHYPIPFYKQPGLRPYFSGEVHPISDEIHATILSLPISPIHSPAEVDQTAKVLKSLC